MTQEEKAFIERVGKLASVDMVKSGVLASLTVAQAILESGWGKSGLTTKGFALFGIKATSGWKGKVYNAKTQECYDGVTCVTIEAEFRAYDSWEESIADHSAFLITNSRYKAVIGEKDYKKACHAIKAAGYATDPGYAEKLISLIEQYGLTHYDKGGIKVDNLVIYADGDTGTALILSQKLGCPMVNKGSADKYQAAKKHWVGVQGTNDAGNAYYAGTNRTDTARKALE